MELGIRGGPANVVTALGIVVVAAALLRDDRIPRRSARLLVVVGLVPAAFLAVRSSGWLVLANLASVAAAFVLAACFARSGSVLDTGPGRLIGRVGAAWREGWTGPRVLGPALPSPGVVAGGRMGQVGLGLFVAVPILFVVVALLASADPVFAGLVVPDVDLGPALGHVVLACTFAAVVVVAVRAGGAEPVDRTPRGRFGPVEVCTALGLTAAVLGLFVASQVVASTAAGHRLIEESGMTPAQYARSGFFQLCWAAGFLLVLLGLVRALAAPATLEQRPVRVLAALVPVLALGLVAVSLRRMALYDQAFGLTMLRLAVTGVALWIGVVLLLVAVRNAGLGRREWVAAGAALTWLVLVLVADVVGPEQFVVRHNVDRAAAGRELDADYLAGLSEDAVPPLVAAYEREDDPARRIELLEAIGCDRRPVGVARWNGAVLRAETARQRVCPRSD